MFLSNEVFENSYYILRPTDDKFPDCVVIFHHPWQIRK